MSLWPFGTRCSSVDATAAVAAAERSQVRAYGDKAHAAEVRAIAEALADRVRAHNAANRYDDFLRRVVQGRD